MHVSVCMRGILYLVKFWLNFAERDQLPCTPALPTSSRWCRLNKACHSPERNEQLKSQQDATSRSVNDGNSPEASASADTFPVNHVNESEIRPVLPIIQVRWLGDTDAREAFEVVVFHVLLW